MTQSPHVVRLTDGDRTVYVRALGTAEIEAGKLRLTPAAERKFALLLRLSAEPGRRVMRATLQELVFPDLTDRNARHSLSDLLYQLRQAGVPIKTSRDGVMLESGRVQSDWEALTRLERPGLEQLRAIETGFLPAYAPGRFEAFSDWLAGYRARATLELCRALGTTINRARTVGDRKLTEHAARACLALDPLHEEATLALAEMLALSGSKAHAMSLLEQYSRDVSYTGADLALPASVVKQRISERIDDTGRSPLTLPFLGRDGEMTALGDRFELAQAGESQCIVIVGEPGIGKTRLAEEFCVQVALNGGRVQRVDTQPHDAHRPMATFADVVPRLLQLPGALGCSPESIAALRWLTKSEGGEFKSEGLSTSSEIVATSISGAIADLVDAVGAEATLVLLIDDAQWTDESSRQVLASLVAAKRHRRLLAILTSRDRSIVQYFARHSERLLAVAMAPLSQPVAAEVLDRALEQQETAPDNELRSWLAEASGGNPFFLRCLIAHFQATGERFVVPTAISALLDQQLAVVGPEALAVLGMTVVLGRHAEIDRLVIALEFPYFQLQIAIRELEAAHLVVANGQRIAPAHWLIAETVTRTTPSVSQRLFHRRAAEILERESENANSGALWDCAEHWIAAGEKAHALRVMRACATRSLEIGRPRQAAEILLRAVTLVDDADRADLIETAVRLSDECAELDLVLRGLKLADDLRVPIHRQEFELAKILAQLSESGESNGVYSTLRFWLQDQHPMPVRLRAFQAIVIAGERTDGPQQSDAAFRDLFPAGVDYASLVDVEVMRVLMIYHSAFGDTSVSVTLSRSLLSRASEMPAVAAANLRRQAALALMRGGFYAEATAAFELAYASAAVCGLRRLQCSIGAMLVSFFVDLLDDSAAARWWAALEELVASAPEFFSSIHYVSLCGDLACWRGDVDGVREAIQRSAELFPAEASPFAARWARIFRARLAHLTGTVRDVEAIVGGLIAHHRPEEVVGALGDLEVAAAVELLESAGYARRARSIFALYFALFRRRGEPVCRWLQIVATRMGWPIPHEAAAPVRTPGAVRAR
jgi:DNA-binding SARP family transcriptional activator